jgi:hypothetical protein
MAQATQRKTYTFGPGNFAKGQIAADVTGFSLEQTRAILVAVVNDVTADQTAQGNPPTLMTVDGNAGKALSSVNSKVVVLYGTLMTRALQAVMENTLAAAIDKGTVARSGNLRNVQSNWQWILVSSDPGKSGPVTDPSKIVGFGINDRLVLRPILDYAGVANRATARAGRLNIKTRGKRGKMGTAENVSKRNQHIGFMRSAAESLRRNSQFNREFSVYAAFTKRFAVPGEKWPFGTPYLTIRPRLRRRG